MKCDRSYKRDVARAAAMKRHLQIMALLEADGMQRDDASKLAYRHITRIGAQNLTDADRVALERALLRETEGK